MTVFQLAWPPPVRCAHCNAGKLVATHTTSRILLQCKCGWQAMVWKRALNLQPTPEAPLAAGMQLVTYVH